VIADLDELRICTAYRTLDGRTTERFFPDAFTLGTVEPVYESFPGFERDITSAADLDDLPDTARKYLDRIADFVGIPIDIVSVGFGREQTLTTRTVTA
jgi:adenylosuccinate synthase